MPDFEVVGIADNLYSSNVTAIWKILLCEKNQKEKQFLS